MKGYHETQAFKASQATVDAALVAQQIAAQQAAKTTADSIIIA